MARRARACVPGGAYHVTARAVGDELIVVSAFDCFQLLALLRDVTRRIGWTVAAWCFMHTHYHLIVRADREARIAEAMHRLNGIYAREFNLRHHRRGHLFAERYAQTPIEDERHLAAACDYVLRNPVVAGLARSIDDWTWSGDGRLEPRPNEQNLYELVTRL
jgi:putative transposase